MLGKRSVIALALFAVLTGSCKKTPTAARQEVSPPDTTNQISPRMHVSGVLKSAVMAYESEPTGERAVDVWTAFGEIDSRLSALRREVAQRAGGARAEAELERIELQRMRDEQMARFAKTQARMENARAALNALIASFDSKDGVRAAASVVTQSLGHESRDWTHGLRGLNGRLQVP